MTEFIVICVALSLVAVAFVLLPMRFNHTVATLDSASRDESNIKAFKIRLQELKQESEYAHYSDQQKQALQQELELRLLDDVTEAPEQQRSTFKLWPIALLMVVLIPLSSWLMYQQLGAKQDFDLMKQLNVFQQTTNAAELQSTGSQLMATLQQQLQTDADQPALLMMLARTQTRLQHYQAAQETFQQLMQLTGEDPVVMGLYAQARYIAGGRQLDAVAKGIAERVLKIQPNNGTVLGMMGMASFEQQDFASAIKYWQQLLALLDPNSSTAKMISQGVQQAKAAAGDGIATNHASNIALTVNVSLAQGLTAPKGAFVFIYARAVNGPKMPLAVVKRLASALPLTVTLDQSMAMTPAMSLANFEQVQLVARVSSSGIANAAAGDLEGLVTPVSNTSSDVIRVVINSVLD
ncbi:MAG: cytochrome c-type biogenesis protein CcmH [Pseudohongiellaceae bacterium]|jgi:cytochrome c-type biogenesis protein CcmH